MKKETLYVAFSTQKGGVGKTTFTVLVASYLYYLKGYMSITNSLPFTSSRHWERKRTRCCAVHRTKR